MSVLNYEDLKTCVYG